MAERRAACSSPPHPKLTRAALCLGSAWLLADCTEPRFAPEPSTDRSPADDAGPADATQAPEDPRWAPWIGRYAVRTILYATDGLLRPTSEEISLVVIEPRADRLVLEQQLCLFEGGWSFVGLEGNLRYRYDDVSFVTEMVLTGRNFDTQPARFRLGFDSEPPRACADAGSTASDQPWLSGECTCPGATSKLPAKPSDCRVTDPDQDEQPGVTFTAALNGTRVAYYAAQEVVVRYSNGYRLGDQLYANVESQASTTIFGCNMPELAADCVIGRATPCPTEFNKAVFVPLADDDYDCRRVVAERAGLFPSPIPPFPGPCAAGL